MKKSAFASPEIAGCPIFPNNNIFNVRIDNGSHFPPHPMSQTWIASVGNNQALHLDWGRNENQANWEDYYGIPFNVIGGNPANTIWPVVSFDITDPRAGNGDGEPSESDCAVATGSAFDLIRGCNALLPSQRRFPYPNADVIKAEYGSCNDSQQCGDRHVLVVEQGRCRLWESYFSYNVDNQWFAYSTAAWDLSSNTMRPDTWTSGDAAGLPILPLLVRIDEADAGQINHALRVTFVNAMIDRAYQWPARHYAGGTNPGMMQFGALLRLKSSFTIPDSWNTQAKAIAQAMKQYGLYVADIGQNFFVQGEPSERWQESTWTQLQSLRLSQFEFVDMSAITNHREFDGNSFSVPSSLITNPTADTTPPVLTQSTPSNNADNVDPQSAITLTFSEAISGTPAITLSVAGNAILTRHVISGSTLTISTDSTPTTGQATLNVTGIRDAQQNQAAAINLTWRYSATPTPDTQAPHIVARTPAPNATNIDPKLPIVLTFSEAIDLSQASWQLTMSGTNVALTTSADTSLRLTPQSPPTGSGQANFTISGVRDEAGNVMPTESWVWQYQSPEQNTSNRGGGGALLHFTFVGLAFILKRMRCEPQRKGREQHD